MLEHVSPNQIWLGLLVLRVSVGVTMIAHGYNHIYRGGKIKGTAGWFASLGMKSMSEPSGTMTASSMPSRFMGWSGRTSANIG